MPDQILDAALLEFLLQLLRDLLILQRQQPRQHFHDGDLRAIGAPDGGKLHADRARPDDHHRFGHLLLQDRLPVGDDLFAIHFPRAGDSHAGTGRDDDVLGIQLSRLAVLVGNGDRCRLRQTRFSHENGDIVLFHQESHALDEPVRDLA